MFVPVDNLETVTFPNMELLNHHLERIDPFHDEVTGGMARLDPLFFCQKTELRAVRENPSLHNDPAAGYITKIQAWLHAGMDVFPRLADLPDRDFLNSDETLEPGHIADRCQSVQFQQQHARIVSRRADVFFEFYPREKMAGFKAKRLLGLIGYYAQAKETSYRTVALPRVITEILYHRRITFTDAAVRAM